MGCGNGLTWSSGWGDQDSGDHYFFLSPSHRRRILNSLQFYYRLTSASAKCRGRPIRRFRTFCKLQEDYRQIFCSNLFFYYVLHFFQFHCSVGKILTRNELFQQCTSIVSVIKNEITILQKSCQSYSDYSIHWNHIRRSEIIFK